MGLYCNASDIADFLRITIDGTTTPTDTQVESLITRNEAKLDRQVGHTFGGVKTITNEIHSMSRQYDYGWGSQVNLQHRQISTLPADDIKLDPGEGDKLEIWDGNSFNDIASNDGDYELEARYGTLHLRGFIYSIIRKNRVRVTYRYGDATVPEDIKDACIKMVSIDMLSPSFRMDVIPMGNSGVSVNESIKYWQNDIKQMISDRAEVFIVGV